MKIVLSRIILFILFTGCVSLYTSAENSLREYALKAGFIFNFGLYSEATDSKLTDVADYVICSSSAPFVDAATKTLAQKKIKQRNVTVTYFSPLEMLKSTCHIIFFTDSDVYESYRTSALKNSKNSMLIGDIPNFINIGGHINFFHIGGKIRFEINPKQLQENGIKVSSKVIRLGKIKKVGNT